MEELSKGPLLYLLSFFDAESLYRFERTSQRFHTVCARAAWEQCEWQLIHRVVVAGPSSQDLPRHYQGLSTLFIHQVDDDPTKTTTATGDQTLSCRERVLLFWKAEQYSLRCEQQAFLSRMQEEDVDGVDSTVGMSQEEAVNSLENLMRSQRLEERILSRRRRAGLTFFVRVSSSSSCRRRHNNSTYQVQDDEDNRHGNLRTTTNKLGCFFVTTKENNFCKLDLGGFQVDKGRDGPLDDLFFTVLVVDWISKSMRLVVAATCLRTTFRRSWTQTNEISNRHCWRDALEQIPVNGSRYDMREGDLVISKGRSSSSATEEENDPETWSFYQLEQLNLFDFTWWRSGTMMNF